MTPQPPDEATASSAQRIGWAILILITLYICYFSHLGVIGFVGPDEPRYAWIARDMAETGDWVTPRLYGKPWFRSEEHTSELQSHSDLVCRLLLEKKNQTQNAARTREPNVDGIRGGIPHRASGSHHR